MTSYITNTLSRICIALFLCIVSLLSADAQKSIVEAKYNVIPDNYNFWISVPEEYNEDRHKMPIVLFLHGASLCGNDLGRVKRYGVIDAVEKGKIIPAICIAPQNRGGAWNPQKLNRLLEWVQENYLIDESRIYVLGMSLGGYGTMDFVNAYPDKVAAAIAMCGGCSTATPDGLGEVPFWIMHGTADRAVGIEQSKKVVSYLESRGKTNLLRYDWWAGGSHGVFARMFYLQKTYDWLFSHSLKQKPRKVDRSFDIDQADLKQTYNELKWYKDMYEDD